MVPLISVVVQAESQIRRLFEKISLYMRPVYIENNPIMRMM